MEKFEIWDFIAAGLFCLALWMHLYGVKLCREADKDGFDERKLRYKVYGAMVTCVVYGLCRVAG